MEAAECVWTLWSPQQDRQERLVPCKEIVRPDSWDGCFSGTGLLTPWGRLLTVPGGTVASGYSGWRIGFLRRAGRQPTKAGCGGPTRVDGG
ncbi:hypothetical protein Kisp02_72570 [Kineosporia sp. NBRC 101731]|nr:hypothetical protein Kisp02_72570 [Kineosporia sp. NBRC 101731]